MVHNFSQMPGPEKQIAVTDADARRKGIALLASTLYSFRAAPLSSEAGNSTGRGDIKQPMTDPQDSLSPLTPPEPMLPAVPPTSYPKSSIFWGPNGMRAGWRLLIFFAITILLLFGAGFVSRIIGRRGVPPNPFEPDVLLRGEAILFGVVLLASWIMSKFEGRSVGDFGLPWRNAFRGEFWKGIAMGFTAISLLLGALRLAGAFYLGDPSLHGAELWKYASLWTCAFLGVAFFEEFGFRGYVLYTLTSGMGFWPAALLCSAIFGGVHIGNSGETWLGALAAGSIGLLFCLMLRRTGTLWLPVGFHAAWDWGETFFYGVPDSGEVAPGHLFNASLTGSKWLTGGSVGPEASVFCILLIAILFVLFAALWPGVRYPQNAPTPVSPLQTDDLKLQA